MATRLSVISQDDMGQWAVHDYDGQRRVAAATYAGLRDVKRHMATFLGKQGG